MRFHRQRGFICKWIVARKTSLPFSKEMFVVILLYVRNYFIYFLNPSHHKSVFPLFAIYYSITLFSCFCFVPHPLPLWFPRHRYYFTFFFHFYFLLLFILFVGLSYFSLFYNVSTLTSSWLPSISFFFSKDIHSHLSFSHSTSRVGAYSLSKIYLVIFFDYLDAHARKRRLKKSLRQG